MIVEQLMCPGIALRVETEQQYEGKSFAWTLQSLVEEHHKQVNRMISEW